MSFKCIKKILYASFYTLEDIKKYKKITKIEKKEKMKEKQKNLKTTKKTLMKMTFIYLAQDL